MLLLLLACSDFVLKLGAGKYYRNGDSFFSLVFVPIALIVTTQFLFTRSFRVALKARVLCIKNYFKKLHPRGGGAAVERVLKCVTVQPSSALDLHPPSAMLPVQT